MTHLPVSLSMPATPNPTHRSTGRLRLGVVRGLVGLMAIGGVFGGQPLGVYAQSSGQEAILPVAPSVLADIREAPFSQVFSLDTPRGGEAFGVKDQDFQSNNSELGVWSLWADAPDIDLLQVAIRYCLPDAAIARSNAHLVAVELRADGKTLVSIDQPAVSTDSTLYEVTPARYTPVTVYSGTFYDPFWSPYYYSTPYYTSTYVPAVQCSLGGSRLDLKPVQAAIATLPDQTLEMRLLFNNGMTSDWRLGQGTVAALKQLPTLQGN